MITSLTQFNVLRYVYNETNDKTDKEIQQAILTDEKIADEFFELSDAKTILDKCAYSASPKTLENILNYSKSKLSPLVG